MRGPKSIEWMASVVVVAILATWGLPAYNNSVSNKQLNTARNELITILNTARSEAVLKRMAVTVCPKLQKNAVQCDPNGNWNNGVLVFYDKKNDKKYGVDDTIILNSEPPYGDLHIYFHPLKQLNQSQSDQLMDRTISFNKQGFASQSAGAFSVCDHRDEAFVRGVVLTSTGNVYFAKDTDRDEDFIPEDSEGHNLRCQG